MFERTRIGSFKIESNNLETFSLALPERRERKYISSFMFVVGISGTATADINNFSVYSEFCTQFEMYLNNKRIVENMKGNDLLFLNSLQGTGYPLEDFNIQNGIEFNIKIPFYIQFYNPDFIGQYDLCYPVSDLQDLKFQFKKSSFWNENATGLNFTVDVISEIIERENIYKTSLINISKQTYTKAVSDIVAVPNRTLYSIFSFTPNVDINSANILLRTQKKVICDYVPISTIMKYSGGFYVVGFDPELGDKFYVPYVNPYPISIEKPTLFENENIFYDKFTSNLIPFSFISYSVTNPPEAVGDQEKISKFAPVKIS